MPIKKPDVSFKKRGHVNIMRFKTAARGKMKNRDTVRSEIEDRVSTAFNIMFQDQIYDALKESANATDCVIFVAGNYGIRAHLEANPRIFDMFEKQKPEWWNTVMSDLRDLDLTVYPRDPLNAAECTNLKLCIKHDVVQMLISKMRGLRRDIHNQIRGDFDNVTKVLKNVAEEVEKRHSVRIKNIDMMDSTHIEIPKNPDGHEMIVMRHGGVNNAKQCTASNMPDLRPNAPRVARNKNACYPLRDSLNATLMFREKVFGEREYMTDFLLLRLALRLNVAMEKPDGIKNENIAVNFIDVSVVREDDESVQNMLAHNINAKLDTVQGQIQKNMTNASKRNARVLPYAPLGYILHQTVRQFLSNQRVVDEQLALEQPDQQVVDHHSAKVNKLALRIGAIRDIVNAERGSSQRGSGSSSPAKLTWIESAFDEVPWLSEQDNPNYRHDLTQTIVNDILPRCQKYMQALKVSPIASLTQKAPSTKASKSFGNKENASPVALPFKKTATAFGKENAGPVATAFKKTATAFGKENAGPVATAFKKTALTVKPSQKVSSIETIDLAPSKATNRVVLGQKSNNFMISPLRSTRQLRV